MTQQIRAIEKERSAPSTSISEASGEPDWFRSRRDEAWQLAWTMPVPAMNQEDWRRTDLSDLDLDSFLQPPPVTDGSDVLPTALQASMAGGSYAGTSIQVGSRIVRRETSPALAESGVIFTDLHTAAREHPELIERYLMAEDGVRPDADKFTALHAALVAGGNLVHVPAGVRVEGTIKCTYWIEDPSAASFPHTLVVLGTDATLSLVDEYISETTDVPALAVPVTEAYLGRSAALSYVGVQRWGQNTWNISRQRFLFEEGASASLLVVALGSRTTKAYVETIFNGAASHASMKGLILGDNQQHIDYQTLQLHAGVGTESDLDFRAALRGKARSVWLGLCHIAKSGQRSNANQSCHNLLLSREAGAFPIPSLEIEANDVKCSHGTAVGQVDEGQVFYAMTRGIDRETAEKMIVDGFFEPLVASIRAEGVREVLQGLLDQRLEY
ncbi:MAG: Fe-S cluster assembly protein SufD [Dehalococcoidia bacterium]|nr:Fe-S cluster assembly protein SufD [Dehalococcoidia bacterium]